MKDYVMFLLMI